MLKVVLKSAKKASKAKVLHVKATPQPQQRRVTFSNFVPEDESKLPEYDDAAAVRQTFQLERNDFQFNA